MREQIYINGQLMQQEGGKLVSLVYQSPYFTDIDAIISNRSTSVDFPRTPGNMRAIEAAGLPQGTSIFEYNQHNAIYIRDGLQVFVGKATVLSITASAIKLSFAWGNIEAFEQLLEANLYDLQTNADEDYIAWSALAQGDYPEFYPEGWNTPRSWSDAEDVSLFPVQPIIPVSRVMHRIADKYNVTFTFPEGVSFDGYHIPVTTRNADERSAETQGVIFGPGSTVAVAQGVGFRHQSEMVSNLAGLGVDGIVDTEERERLGIKIGAGLQVGIPTAAVGGTSAGVKVCDITENGTARVIATVPTTRTMSDGLFIYTVENDYSLIIEDPSQYYSIGIVIGQSARSIGNLSLVAVENMSSVVIYDATLETAEYGSMIPIYRNLPDWTIADFIKNLMKIEGIFAYASSKNEIRFVSLDEIYANRVQAVDWSDKVMTEDGRPTETVASFNDLAQKNWFRYAEDDTVMNNYDGYISVQSNILEAETDLVELDFAPTEDDIIPVWVADDSTSTGYEWQDVEPRILKRQDDASISFKGLSWDALLGTQYASYAQTISTPRTIKCSVFLDTLDLLLYSPNIPVYVRQWGHYYAIIKLTTKDNGKADVELLQLGAAQ